MEVEKDSRHGGSPAMDFGKLSSEFEQKEPTLQRLKEEALFILNEALKKKDIKVHLVTSRVKSIKSFIDKVNRKQSEKPFEEIQDIVGLRVVCLFLSDIPRIGDVVRSCFEVLSEDNKIEDYEVSSFGYLSVHFIAKMKKELAGPRYDEIKGVPFEIQVRTIAMDAWATISHYLDYKTDQDVPRELKRDFYGLSGLFYVADTHFEIFFRSREESREKIALLFEKGKQQLDQEINLDSLAAYLHKNFPDRRHSSPKEISELIHELVEAGYKSIGDVDRVVRTASHAFLVYEKEHPPRDVSRYSNVGVVRISFNLVDEEFRKSQDFGSASMLSKYRTLLKE